MNRALSGIVILIIGVLFLLRNFDVSVPDWLFSWNTILLAIGLYVGFKRNFTGSGWIIMVLIGGYFTLNDITDFDFGRYFFAVAFIILGLFLILKPKKNKVVASAAPDTGFVDPERSIEGEKASTTHGLDTLDSVSVFGVAHRKISSRSFKGGEVVAVFGGGEINLSQADFNDVIQIEIAVIFGGIKIVVPPTWEVESELAAVFGGMDDKRTVTPFGDGQRKVLVIKGVAIFGGVEIKNF